LGEDCFERGLIAFVASAYGEGDFGVNLSVVDVCVIVKEMIFLYYVV